MLACGTIIVAVSQLLIKYLSSMANPIVAEQIYMMPELQHRYQRIFIHQLNNFYIDNIRIYFTAARAGLRQRPTRP